LENVSEKKKKKINGKYKTTCRLQDIRRIRIFCVVRPAPC
jgi:hypothetical protein